MVDNADAASASASGDPEAAREVRRFLESGLEGQLAWLRRMVDVNSFTANPGGVNRLGELTAEAFADLGFAAESEPSADSRYGRHLFLDRGPGDGRRILLVTHLDTVFPPDEEEREAFRWEPAPHEGRIYGPGTVDIKGGTILIRMFLEALRRFAPDVFEGTRWTVAANASEEATSADFAERMIRRSGGRADAVLVFEGGILQGERYHVVTARKGKADFRIRASGRAAHAGSLHSEGINAITQLAHSIGRVSGLTDYGRELTVNVGVVRGGTVVNRVPHEAEAELEMRAFDPDVMRTAGDAVRAEAARPPEVAGARIHVECLGETAAWPGGDGTRALAEAWDAAARALGGRAHEERRGGLSDANYLCGLGPTLDGLGPSGGNAHCSQRMPEHDKLPEFVEPGSFVPKTLVNMSGFLRWIGASAG